MKKMMFIAMMAASLCMVSCQKAQQEANAATGEDKVEVAATTGINNWTLAMELAAYGYENESASALIEAANILMTIPTEELVVEREEKETAEAEAKDEKPAVTVEQLLLDAAEFGACPAAIEAAQARYEAINASEEARGAVGGAKFVTDRVYSHDYERYYCDFRGGEYAQVTVIGDHDTDLDLYIYDENEHLIAYDDDLTDVCICSFTPSWTGRFYMKVVNRGNVYNNFTLATN